MLQEGITHVVEITASTLYEAAALALAEFRRCGFAEATFGPGTKLRNCRTKRPGYIRPGKITGLRNIGISGTISYKR